MIWLRKWQLNDSDRDGDDRASVEPTFINIDSTATRVMQNSPTAAYGPVGDVHHWEDGAHILGSTSSGSTPHAARIAKKKLHLFNPMSLLLRRRSSRATALGSDLATDPLKIAPPMRLPDNYDPRIRGAGVHDFNAPRARTKLAQNDANSQPAQNSVSYPSTLQPASADGVGHIHLESPMASAVEPGRTSDAAAVTSASPGYPAGRHHEGIHGSDISRQQALHPQADVSQPTEDLESLVAHIQPRHTPPPPQYEARSHRSVSTKSTEKNMTETEGSSGQEPVTVLRPEKSIRVRAVGAHRKRQSRGHRFSPPDGVPKHMNSNSSRFSFDLVGIESAAQERLLEEKHRRLVANKLLLPLPPTEAGDRGLLQGPEAESDDASASDTEYDELYEEAIPGVNVDAPTIEEESSYSSHFHNGLQEPAIPAPLHPTKTKGAGLTVATAQLAEQTGQLSHSPDLILSSIQESLTDGSVSPQVDGPSIQTKVEISATPLFPAIDPDLRKASRASSYGSDGGSHYDNDEDIRDHASSGSLQPDDTFDDNLGSLYEMENPWPSSTTLPTEEEPDRPAPLNIAHSYDLTYQNLIACNPLAASADSPLANPNLVEGSEPPESASEGVFPRDLPRLEVTSHVEAMKSESIRSDELDESLGEEDAAVDDDPMIAAANAEALASDADGFYGQEFGFYANANGVSDSEYALGGFFGSMGNNAFFRSFSGNAAFQEPNLTPITERSEYSARSSFIFPYMPPGQSAQPLPSPGLAQLAAMMDSSTDDDLTLANLQKLRREAWAGSNGSLHSAESSGGQRTPARLPPLSPVEKVYPPPSPAFNMSTSRLSLSGTADTASAHGSSGDAHSSPVSPLMTYLPPLGAPPVAAAAAAVTLSSDASSPTKPEMPINADTPMNDELEYKTESVRYVKEEGPSGEEQWVVERLIRLKNGHVKVIGREPISGGRI